MLRYISSYSPEKNDKVERNLWGVVTPGRQMGYDSNRLFILTEDVDYNLRQQRGGADPGGRRRGFVQRESGCNVSNACRRLR